MASFTPWVPQLWGENVQCCAKYEEWKTENPTPNSIQHPGWSDVEVGALFVTKSRASGPIKESVLALWRLGALRKSCEGSKAWRMNVRAWLVSNRWYAVVDSC